MRAPSKVTSVDLSTNGMVLASGSGDHQVRICEFRLSLSQSVAEMFLSSMQGITCYNDADENPVMLLTSYETASTCSDRDSG